MNEHGDGDGSSNGNGDELQALAAQFVDLWQRQLENMASDPALNKMMMAYAKFGAQAPCVGAGPAPQNDIE